MTKQDLRWALIIGGVYALGAQAVFWYIDPADPGSVFFPAAGISMAALLLTSPKKWPIWLGAIAIAEFTVDVANRQAVWMAIGFALANTAEPLVGASLARLDTMWRRRSRHGLQIRYFVCCVVIGPLVGGIIGASVFWLSDIPTNYLQKVGEWWLGDGLGVLVVATPILAWSRRNAYVTTASLPEDFVIAGVAVAATLVPALVWHTSTAYAILPVLLWAALRGGPVGVGISGLGFAFAAYWVVVTDRIDDLLPFTSKARMLVEVQVFIAITLTAAWILAVQAAERVRAERKLREAEADRTRQQLASLQAVMTERRRIALETHDIVGHALNVMILSAGAARRVMLTDPPAATELLGTAEEVGRDAFRDLDVALGLVDPTAEISPARGVDDLDELIGRLTRAGVDVELQVNGDRRALPKLVDWSAYRIVQESLTNVTKHANGSKARVDVQYEARHVLLTISDSGSHVTSTNGHGGRGLIGMQERVAMLGGNMEVGRVADGRFVVHAEIPTGHA